MPCTPPLACKSVKVEGPVPCCLSLSYSGSLPPSGFLPPALSLAFLSLRMRKNQTIATQLQKMAEVKCRSKRDPKYSFPCAMAASSAATKMTVLRPTILSYQFSSFFNILSSGTGMTYRSAQDLKIKALKTATRLSCLADTHDGATHSRFVYGGQDKGAGVLF